MKIFVTGHRGYIGSHLVDVLKQEGHTVVGCDVKLFEGCNWEPLVAPDVDLAKDVRAVEAEDLDGCDCVMHLAAISNDPMGDLDPQITFDINRDASIRLAGTGQAGRRAPVPLRRELLDLRQGGEARPRRGRPAQPPDRLRQVQDRDRAGRLRAGRRELHPGLPPQRHGLRPLADAPDRPGRQQPAGLGPVLRRDPHPVRRLALAAPDPLPRHRPGVRRLRRGAQGGHPRPGHQRRRQRARTTRSATSATRSSG